MQHNNIAVVTGSDDLGELCNTQVHINQAHDFLKRSHGDMSAATSNIIRQEERQKVKAMPEGEYGCEKPACTCNY